MERPFLMGSETEYALCGRFHRRIVPPEILADWLADMVRLECNCLQDLECRSGVFLENGARLYTDINGHPEYATPECSTPREVAAHDQAGERILQRVARRLAAERGVQLVVTKNNLGALLPDTVTWGNHESYLSWVSLDAAAEYLIPHLVTRLPYAGSGCLSAHPEGIGFELSQRARHLVRVVGNETTHDRAIFCTRVRKASDQSSTGWIRAHLIGKDSQRAQLGTYLTFGTTGLLFWMLNHGFQPRRRLTLADPVQALRTISRDPWLRAPVHLADRRQLTAVEIQESYLTDCEQFAARGGPLPDWGQEVLKQWRSVLTALVDDPYQLAGRLDAYTKLLLYEHELRRAGRTWAELHGGLQLLGQLRKEFPSPIIQALITEDYSALSQNHRPAYEAACGLIGTTGPQALPSLKFTLRLQALELRYHELGGFFDDLSAAGYIRAEIVTEQEIGRATKSAPLGGRAERRAQLIQLHHGDANWLVGWQQVVNRADCLAIDLSDPFESNGKAVEFTPS